MAPSSSKLLLPSANAKTIAVCQPNVDFKSETNTLQHSVVATKVTQQCFIANIAPPTATVNAKATRLPEAHSVVTEPSDFELLSTIPYHVLVGCVLPFLSLPELTVFGLVSKATRPTSEAGHLWRDIFNLKYPRSSLTPRSAWRMLADMHALP
jgi:hypothetical protein